MKKQVKLPLSKPVYSTYHYQGSGSVILYDNPSIRNWFLNQKMLLCCNKRFLEDAALMPEITVNETSYTDNPFLECVQIPMKHLGGYVHPVIRNMIDDGFYIVFSDIDDFYVEGKSWYHTKHYPNDGLIFGYDQERKIYNIYAYDQSFHYRAFDTPQKSFEKGRLAQCRKNCPGNIYALKPKMDLVSLDPIMIYDRIKEYLGLRSQEIASRKEDYVYGAVVQDYIRLYLGELADSSIPYERIDWLIFRMLWEHKKIMLERLIAVENTLRLDHDISSQYAKLILLTDDLQKSYAAFYAKRDNSILSYIQGKLYELRTLESNLLIMFLLKLEKERVI